MPLQLLLPPSLLPRCPCSAHPRDDKESSAFLLLPPPCRENALSRQNLSTLRLILTFFSAFHLFLSPLCLHYCTIPPSLQNLTFAMRYPYLPFTGDVATATMDSTCLSPAHLCNTLPLSLSFSPHSPDASLLSDYTEFTAF